MPSRSFANRRARCVKAFAALRSETTAGEHVFSNARAADESALRGFHNFAAPDCRRYRIAISQRLAEYRHVGLHAVHQVQTAEGLAKP